jgi:hypothetical protein
VCVHVSARVCVCVCVQHTSCVSVLGAQARARPPGAAARGEPRVQAVHHTATHLGEHNATPARLAHSPSVHLHPDRVCALLAQRDGSGLCQRCCRVTTSVQAVGEGHHVGLWLCVLACWAWLVLCCV